MAGIVRKIVATFKAWVAELKVETYALYLACKDPRTPWYAKALAAAVAAYAFSPIDLIPDFIPVIGYLDDLIIVPLGIALAVRLIPPEVLSRCRSEARTKMDSRKPTNWYAGAVIIAVWIVVLVAVGLAIARRVKK